MLPAALDGWSAARGGVRSAEPLAGGDINDVRRVRFQDGSGAVVKLLPSAPAGFFAAEAEGLATLAATATVRVPAVLGVGDHHLLLEDLGEGEPADGFWDRFAQGLARLHAVHAPRHGWTRDKFIGRSLQPNGWLADGWEFFAERRLRHQADLAHGSGRLDRRDRTRVETLCGRLRELIPAQPASLLHGDLWSGNAHACGDGSPALLDPAVHYGWSECDIAMTALFGIFPARFYLAYDEAAGMESGWQERLPIYQLYHLLNHLNLFGGSYLASVRAILDRYVG